MKPLLGIGVKANAVAEGELDWGRTAYTVRFSSCLDEPHPKHYCKYFLSTENLTSRGAGEVRSCELAVLRTRIMNLRSSTGSGAQLVHTRLGERFARNLYETGITSNFTGAHLPLDRNNQVSGCSQSLIGIVPLDDSKYRTRSSAKEIFTSSCAFLVLF
jgi:hypothetical protein